VALQLVTGRFVLSVSEKVLLNAVRAIPEADCPAVMIGTPSVIVKAMFVAGLVPLPLVAVKIVVNAPFVVGVPETVPVVVLSVSPEGSPVADQEVAGLFSASLSPGVLENATPTFPVKLCPPVMMGASLI
jgi:hypothetical protein